MIKKHWEKKKERKEGGKEEIKEGGRKRGRKEVSFNSWKSQISGSIYK